MTLPTQPLPATTSADPKCGGSSVSASVGLARYHGWCCGRSARCRRRGTLDAQLIEADPVAKLEHEFRLLVWQQVGHVAELIGDGRTSSKPDGAHKAPLRLTEEDRLRVGPGRSSKQEI